MKTGLVINTVLATNISETIAKDLASTFPIGSTMNVRHSGDVVKANVDDIMYAKSPDGNGYGVVAKLTINEIPLNTEDLLSMDRKASFSIMNTQYGKVSK